MDARLMYTMEEVHEMHKRIILNGIFSMQRDGASMVTAADCERICDDADRLVNELSERKLVKE